MTTLITIVFLQPYEKEKEKGNKPKMKKWEEKITQTLPLQISPPAMQPMISLMY